VLAEILVGGDGCFECVGEFATQGWIFSFWLENGSVFIEKNPSWKIGFLFFRA
jgi:hypothetical protein